MGCAGVYSNIMLIGTPCAALQVLFAYELQRRLGPLGVQVRPKPPQYSMRRWPHSCAEWPARLTGWQRHGPTQARAIDR